MSATPEYDAAVVKYIGCPHYCAPAHAALRALAECRDAFQPAPSDRVVDWPIVAAIVNNDKTLTLQMASVPEFRVSDSGVHHSTVFDAHVVRFEVPKQTAIPATGQWTVANASGPLKAGSYDLSKCIGGETQHGVMSLTLGVGLSGAAQAVAANLPACRLHLHLKAKNGQIWLKSAQLMCFQNPRFSPMFSRLARAFARVTRNFFYGPQHFLPEPSAAAPQALSAAKTAAAVSVDELAKALVDAGVTTGNISSAYSIEKQEIAVAGYAPNQHVALGQVSTVLTSVAIVRLLLDKEPVYKLREPGFLLGALRGAGNGAVADALEDYYGRVGSPTPTVEELLLHTAGLPSHFALTFKDVTAMLLSSYGTPTKFDQMPRSKVLAELLREAKPIAAPGLARLESEIGYMILAHAIPNIGQRVRDELAALGVNAADSKIEDQHAANWLFTGLELSPVELAGALKKLLRYDRADIVAYAMQPAFQLPGKYDACPGGWLRHVDERSGAEVRHAASYAPDTNELCLAVAMPDVRAVAVLVATINSSANVVDALNALLASAIAQLHPSSHERSSLPRPAVTDEQAVARLTMSLIMAGNLGPRPADAMTPLAKQFGGRVTLDDITGLGASVTFTTMMPAHAPGAWVESIKFKTSGNQVFELGIARDPQTKAMYLVNPLTNMPGDVISLQSMEVGGSEYKALVTPYGLFAGDDVKELLKQINEASERQPEPASAPAPSSAAELLAGNEPLAQPTVEEVESRIAAVPASIGELLIGKRGWMRRRHPGHHHGRRLGWFPFMAGALAGVAMSPFYGHRAYPPPYYYWPYGYGW